jgi:F-type H+-transporting ATPase subunit b
MKRSLVSVRALSGALLSTGTLLCAGIAALALTVSAPASAQHAHAEHGMHDAGAQHGAAQHAEGHQGHGAAEHGEAAGHGEHGAHHEPHFSDINWFHGLLGEKEGVEPNLLWRAPGTPVPLGALLINSAVLFWLLIKLGGPAIRKALLERKKRVASGIEAAAAMKAEAEGQLEFYEEKLRKLDQEIENIRTQMREQAEAERRRILAEAKSEREQLERDAHVLVQQELKVARQELFQEVVDQAIRAAEATIKMQVNEADQQRLADDFLATLDGALRGPGRATVESRS